MTLVNTTAIAYDHNYEAPADFLSVYSLVCSPMRSMRVYRDLVKFPPICIDTQWLACAIPRLNNINPHHPLLFSPLLLRRYTNILLPVPDGSQGGPIPLRYGNPTIS